MSKPVAIADALLSIVEEAHHQLALPQVKRVWLPRWQPDPPKSAEFGVVVLDDDSAGLAYVLLDDALGELTRHGAGDALTGADPVVLARGFADDDPATKVLGLGAINAISQHVIRRSGLALDTETNSLAAFDPGPGDRLGMVGFFPPLVERLVARGVDLTVVELKAELVQRADGLVVTLDPEALRGCNQILCTSTMLLNDSVDRMLAYCAHAEQVAVIGPSAGFLPDPLFDRGVHTVGGQQILDISELLRRSEAEQKWGPAARKVCLHRHDYPGYRALLRQIRQGEPD